MLLMKQIGSSPHDHTEQEMHEQVPDPTSDRIASSPLGLSVVIRVIQRERGYCCRGAQRPQVVGTGWHR